MLSKRILVTGATGFIGLNLVKSLIDQGHQVSALVRAQSKASKTNQLKKMGATLVQADLQDKISLSRAVADQQVVFHLAVVARAVKLETFRKVNLVGLGNLLESVTENCDDAKFVHVSTLSAAGPSKPGMPNREDLVAAPISNYGKSKRDAENLAAQFCDRLNISIVRPPVVLGPHDFRGGQMFKLIQRWGIHFTPGKIANEYSVIHVEDLCSALIAVARHGKPITRKDSIAGMYYAAADEIITYRNLGAMINQALGRQSMMNLPIPHALLKLIGSFNTLVGNLSGQPRFLNFDKVRDMTAGSWSCENRKLKEETGFTLPVKLADRIAQTVHWYCNSGWLKPIATQEIQRSPVTSDIDHGSDGSTISMN